MLNTIKEKLNNTGRWIKERIKWILVVTGIVGIAFAAGTLNNNPPINGNAASPLEERLEQIKNQIADIQIAASNLNEIVVKAEQAILTEEVENVEGETEIVVKIGLTTEQKQALLDEYQIRKQILIDAVNALW